jgi:hypothetical protein
MAAKIRANGALALYGGATAVGAAPVVGDDSDATYVDSADFLGKFVVGVEALPAHATDAILFVRTSFESPIPWDDGAGFEAWLATDAAGDFPFFGYSDGTVVTFAEFPAVGVPLIDGTIQTVSCPITDDMLSLWGVTLEGVLTWFKTGSVYLSVKLFRLAGEAPTETAPWRVYDAWFEYPGRTAVRKYPRDDGLGHSSAPRKYPPTKANRIIGGYT